MCGCSSSNLCPLCLDGRFSQLKGVAACRGEAWADQLALRVRDRRPWQNTPRVRALARDKVADLAVDPHLLAMLADELVHWAARRWSSD